MGIIIWVLVGVLVGWVISLMNTKPEEEGFSDIIAGSIGALAGGALMSYFSGGDVAGFDLYSFLVALVGAIALVVIVRAMRPV
jgi:uncharacterized membrane protein YeaQ/YmgE (transglycosylase-associated protein family)